MGRFVTLLAAALMGLAPPLYAQDGPVSWAYFVTAADEDFARLEEGIRSHNRWHADRNDTWAWMTYQALTGAVPEYVIITPGHMWADFDNPTVNTSEDEARWARDAGGASASVRSAMWSNMSDLGRPWPADAVIPLFEVVEWYLKPGSEVLPAVMYAFEKVKTAMDAAGSPLQYTVNMVQSSDEAPTMFVALAHQGFAALDGGDPNGFAQFMVESLGHVEGTAVLKIFDDNLKPKTRRFWLYREDLSYVPAGM